MISSAVARPPRTEPANSSGRGDARWVGRGGASTTGGGGPCGRSAASGHARRGTVWKSRGRSATSVASNQRPRLGVAGTTVHLGAGSRPVSSGIGQLPLWGDELRETGCGRREREEHRLERTEGRKAAILNTAVLLVAVGGSTVAWLRRRSRDGWR